MNNLDLIKKYKDINMHIIKFFEKAYVRYNKVYIKLYLTSFIYILLNAMYKSM